MMFLTPEQISNVTGANLQNVEANWPLVCGALEWAEINRPLVQVGVAATIAIETGNFLPIKEKESKNPDSAVYKAQQRYYPSGYYGRGYVQLTWKYNYEAATRALGENLIDNPDLALQSDTAAKILAWFFKTRRLTNGGRLLYVACLNKDWPGVRLGVNGPGYQNDMKSLTRFMGYCDALAKIGRVAQGEALNG